MTGFGKHQCPHCGRRVHETDPRCPSCGTACRAAVLCDVCGLKYGHDVEVHRIRAAWTGMTDWRWGSR